MFSNPASLRPTSSSPPQQPTPIAYCVRGDTFPPQIEATHVVWYVVDMAVAQFSEASCGGDRTKPQKGNEIRFCQREKASFWKAFTILVFEGLVVVCVFESSLFEASLLEASLL